MISMNFENGPLQIFLKELQTHQKVCESQDHPLVLDFLQKIGLSPSDFLHFGQIQTVFRELSSKKFFFTSFNSYLILKDPKLSGIFEKKRLWFGFYFIICDLQE